MEQRLVELQKALVAFWHECFRDTILHCIILWLLTLLIIVRFRLNISVVPLAFFSVFLAGFGFNWVRMFMRRPIKPEFVEDK